MIQVKNILCDIIDNTYGKHPNTTMYKKFYIEISERNLKSRHGDYHPKYKKICIYNLYRDDAAIIATTIHELAHHVDFINRGTTNHDNEFYSVFKILLYSALDMKIFKIEDFLNANKDAADSNKITKMIEFYHPKETNYKKNITKVVVKNCFDVKNKLKEQNYYYNAINKTWEKEIDNNSINNEISFLKELKVEYEIMDANTITFEKVRYMYIGEGSFEIKEKLKEFGFVFDGKSKSWKKEYNEKEYVKYRTIWPRLQIKIK